MVVNDKIRFKIVSCSIKEENDRTGKSIFEQLEEKSKDNPMLKVEFAAKEISAQIQQACLDDKKVIMGDWCLYMASVLAGISCIKSSKADIVKMRAKIDLIVIAYH